MTASAAPGVDMVWPDDPRTRALAVELYQSVADRPLVSVHNGLPGRYLAEDLPLTDPIGLLIAHDQGVQALLRAHGIRSEFSPMEGWQTERASRQAFVLLQRHLNDVRSRPWTEPGDGDIAGLVGLPPFGPDAEPEAVYDALSTRLAEQPVYPRQMLAAANLRLLATSDDCADDLASHRILAEDATWTGRIVPTFSPDRYLEPGRRGWRTDADLLAEVTGIDTDDLAGFLEALAQRRAFFVAAGARVSEHHCSDVGVARLDENEAAALYRLARSGELLPAEAVALQRHLLWEMGRMTAEDGLVMAIYPPAGFRSSTDATSSAEPDDRGVADRVRPLLASFGSAPRFRMWLFSIDPGVYSEEIVAFAAEHQSVTAVSPTRFADDPAVLRAARMSAISALGSRRSLGLVDDMSGPFALQARHHLARRLDAGALAGLVVAGKISEERARAELSASLDAVLA